MHERKRVNQSTPKQNSKVTTIIYSLRPEILVGEMDVSRHILVLDTSIFIHFSDKYFHTEVVVMIAKALSLFFLLSVHCSIIDSATGTRQTMKTLQKVLIQQCCCKYSISRRASLRKQSKQFTSSIQMLIKHSSFAIVLMCYYASN